MDRQLPQPVQTPPLRPCCRHKAHKATPHQSTSPPLASMPRTTVPEYTPYMCRSERLVLAPSMHARAAFMLSRSVLHCARQHSTTESLTLTLTLTHTHTHAARTQEPPVQTFSQRRCRDLTDALHQHCGLQQEVQAAHAQSNVLPRHPRHCKPSARQTPTHT